MYNQPNSTLINNGYLSNSFTPVRGVRQGCPLSPYLFLLCIEILAIKIRSNSCIIGLKPNGIETKLTLYADDATFFCSLKNLHWMLSYSI